MTIVNHFMREIGKHDLLTSEQEVTKFTRLAEIKTELITKLNNTSVLYNRVPALLFLLSDGYEAVKTFVEPHKFELRTKELTPHVISTLEQYQTLYQQKVIHKKPETKAALDTLTLDLHIESSYLTTMAEDFVKYVGDKPLVDMHLTPEALEYMQYMIGDLLREQTQIKKDIVNANLRLVVKLARAKMRENTHLQMLDLIQEGSIGLMKAAERFDVTTGNKFSTMATFWINQAITRSLQNNARTIRLPVNVQDHLNKAMKVMAQLAAKLKRHPSDQEVADALGFTLPRYMELKQSLTQMTSLDAPAGGEDDNQMTLADIIADTAVEHDMAIYSEQMQEHVRGALLRLAERERIVIEYRYGFNGEILSLSEVAAEIDCSKQTVQNTEQRALQKLQVFLRDTFA